MKRNSPSNWHYIIHIHWEAIFQALTWVLLCYHLLHEGISLGWRDPLRICSLLSCILIHLVSKHIFCHLKTIFMQFLKHSSMKLGFGGSHLLDGTLATDSDGRKFNFGYGFPCCFKGCNCWVCLPVIICLWDQKIRFTYFLSFSSLHQSVSLLCQILPWPLLKKNPKDLTSQDQ